MSLPLNRVWQQLLRRSVQSSVLPDAMYCGASGSSDLWHRLMVRANCLKRLYDVLGPKVFAGASCQQNVVYRQDADHGATESDDAQAALATMAVSFTRPSTTTP